VSISALLIATRNWVRDNLDLDESTCDVMPGPEPPAACGERFFSIYGRAWRPGDFDLNRGIDEYYDIAIAVTFRSTWAPKDKHAENIFLAQSEGLEEALRELLPIHQNIELMTAANNRIIGSNKIIEPLRWKGSDAMPTPVGPAWFSSRGESQDAGYVMEITFGDARRKQTLANLVNGT
jgi:hypothetical protein